MRKRSGFTLIELMVVMLIIGILAAILIPVVFGLLYRAKKAETVHNMNQITAALDRYFGRWYLFADLPVGTHSIPRPMDILLHEMDADGVQLGLPAKFMIQDVGGAGLGPWQKGLSASYSHPGDSWLMGISFVVTNQTMPDLASRHHTTELLLRSHGGSYGDATPDDDIVRRWTREDNSWRSVRVTEVDGATWTVVE
jgi:prepilin-type N-terminal cleavage/methylation domain-containing protein